MTSTPGDRPVPSVGSAAAEGSQAVGTSCVVPVIHLAQAHIGFALQRPALFKWMFEAASW